LAHIDYGHDLFVQIFSYFYCVGSILIRIWSCLDCPNPKKNRVSVINFLCEFSHKI